MRLYSFIKIGYHSDYVEIVHSLAEAIMAGDKVRIQRPNEVTLQIDRDGLANLTFDGISKREFELLQLVFEKAGEVFEPIRKGNSYYVHIQVVVAMSPS